MSEYSDARDTTAFPWADLSLPSLINVPPYLPPRRRQLRPGRPVSGPLGDGPHPGRRRGSGSDLDSIGAFQDGDDPRHIDWAATARTGRPQVRRFLNNTHRPLSILVDLRASMYFGTTASLLAATACREAAGLSAYLLKRREPFAIYGLLRPCSPDDRPPRASTSASARAAQLDQLIRAYRAGLGTAENMQPTLDQILSASWEHIPFNHDIMIVSDFSAIGDSIPACIRQRRAGSVHALIVSDPVFNTGFIPGLYPGRANPQSPSEAYQLPRRAAQAQREHILEWRNELVSRLERQGFGTIWERSR